MSTALPLGTEPPANFLRARVSGWGGSVSAGHALDVQALRLIEHDLARLLRGETLSVDDELALLSALESAVASQPLQFLVGMLATHQLLQLVIASLTARRAALRAQLGGSGHPEVMP